ncbi:MAG: hypothetical protein WC028_31550, partial [Candidatus Obscuribacterales bacterium]
ASDLVVKESTPGVKIEPSPLAATTTVARDLSSPVAPAKDTTTTTLAAKDASPAARVETSAVTPASNNKVEVASAQTSTNKVEVVSNTQLAGVHSVTQASLRTDGSVDKSAKQVSTETLVVAPIAAAIPISSIAQTAIAPATKDSAPKEPASKEQLTKGDTPLRLFDGLQTAANSTAPKALVSEQSLNNHLNQPASALSAALAAAINSRMIGQSGQSIEPSKATESAHITTKPQPLVSGAAGTASMIDTSTIAATRGSILGVAPGAKTESGFGAGKKSEVVAPAKTEALSVNSEIKFPLGSKVKKSETEASTDDATIITATNARVFGTGGNGGAGAGGIIGTGTNATNTINGQVIDPTAAGMIGGTITPKPFDLPPLEITDKENENGRSSKHNGSNTNSGNKTNGGPSQKEMSDALQALIEKRRKERTRKPTTSTGKKTPVYKPEKQRRCLVLKGDTLESLAEQYLADGKLAELIYEINKGFWREKRRAGVVYLEFIPGSTIFLPTEEEIALFRRKKIENGKPYLSFKCSPPKAVRSLRQSVKQHQQEQQEATVELKLVPELAQSEEKDLNCELETESEHDTVAIAQAVPPSVFTASASAPNENSIEKALAVQLIAHLAQVSETSRILHPNQARQVRELEESSRVTVIGEQSAHDATAYVARIEVLCENVWQPVMEYIIDGALADATLKIYSLGGKVREIDLDLPLSIIREMALNDLTANRLNYCKKYLLGRKIFC